MSEFEEEESADSKSDLIASALAMVALGAIILAIGAWCAVGLAGLFEADGITSRAGFRSRRHEVLPFLFLGGGTLLGVGSGLWLVFSGLRVVFKMMLGKKKFD